LDDFKDKPWSPKNPHRKFTDEDYQEVVRAFDRTREDVNSGYRPDFNLSVRKEMIKNVG
jgi:hypothetical protein